MKGQHVQLYARGHIIREYYTGFDTEITYQSLAMWNIIREGREERKYFICPVVWQLIFCQTSEVGEEVEWLDVDIACLFFCGITYL